MAKINLNKPAKKVLEINGKEYEIAQRTGALEKRIIEEHDKKMVEMTEFQRCKVIIDLILGDGVFEEIFPGGENDNLDMMAEVAYVAQHEFNAEKRAAERRRIDQDIKDMGMDKMISALKDFNKQSGKLMNNVAVMSNKNIQ